MSHIETFQTKLSEKGYTEVKVASGVAAMKTSRVRLMRSQFEANQLIRAAETEL